MMNITLHAIIVLTLTLGIPSYSHGQTQTHTSYIFAHRASSGLWIQNSRHAVNNTIDLFATGNATFHGIEVDIVLTKDNVPVLSHDPWVHTRLCERVDQQALQKTLIRHMTWDDLRRNYRCGGIQDSEFPLAVTQSSTIMRFDEFLLAIAKTPSLMVYLDIKLQPHMTASAKDYATAIFSRWRAAGLSNPLYIEGPTQDSIAAYQQFDDVDFTSVLSYPPFYAGENWWIKGAKTALMSFIFPSRAVNTANNANAHGVATPIEVLNQAMRKKLHAAHKKVIVFTPNSAKDMLRACRAQVDIIITDYPTLGGCQAQK